MCPCAPACGPVADTPSVPFIHRWKSEVLRREALEVTEGPGRVTGRFTSSTKFPCLGLLSVSRDLD